MVRPIGPARQVSETIGSRGREVAGCGGRSLISAW
jgi:hypothetical protein